MAKIRHEINLQNRSTLGTGNAQEEKVVINLSRFNGSVSLYLEVVAKISSGSGDCLLANATTGNFLLSSEIVTTGVTNFTLLRGSNFVNDANFVSGNEYSLVVGTTTTVLSAKVIIIQDTGSDAITNSEDQYEIGANETGKTNTAAAALNAPKYWGYNSSDYDGTTSFETEVVYLRSSNMDSTTITLQQDDGFFGVWTNTVTIVNAGTATSATRVRISFTPVSGRHYRISALSSSNMSTYDIYCAKIIVTQTLPPSDSSTGLTYYFDTFNADPGSAWTNDTNAFDGNTSTNATTTSLGSTSSNYLEGTGTTATSRSESVSVVSGRFYGSDNGQQPKVAFLDSSNNILGEATRIAGSPTSYVLLNKAIWSWSDVQTLKCRAYNTLNGSTFNVARMEVLVITGDTSRPITKFKSEYLLVNSSQSALNSGLKLFSVYDPAEWSGVSVDYKTAIDTNSNTARYVVTSGSSSGAIPNSYTYVISGTGTAAIGTVAQLFGDGGTGNERWAQSFRPVVSFLMTGFEFQAGKQGTPTDNFIINVSRALGQTGIWSGSLGGAGLSAGTSSKTFNIGPPFTGSTGVFYSQMQRDGARNTSNYFNVRVSHNDFGWNGEVWESRSSSWVSHAKDVIYTILPTNLQQETFSLIMPSGSGLIDSMIHNGTVFGSRLYAYTTVVESASSPAAVRRIFFFF